MARVTSKQLDVLADRLSDITGKKFIIGHNYWGYSLDDYTNGGCRSVESGLTAKEMRLFLIGTLTGTDFVKK